MKKTILFFFLPLFFVFSGSCSKSADPEPESTLPSLSVVDVIQQRDAKNSAACRFSVYVSVSYAKDIKISYATQDGTATAGKDYTSVSGTLTIPAGQIVGHVDVMVFPDSLRNSEQFFTLTFSSPVNATISGTGKATGTILNDGTWFPVDGSGYTAPDSYAGMKLTWSDEFSGKTLDNESWTCETGGGGWGNNELENYTSGVKNSFLSNGYLILEARKEKSGGNNYTSARIISKDKKTFTCGRIDIRARLPKGKGIWPALWMLGNNISQTPWPACGEIDIMELLGDNPRIAYGTMHWGNAGSGSIHIGGNYTLSPGDFSEKFHVFSLKWEVDNLAFLVDDITYFTGNKSQVTGNYPFDKPFFFIMNVAVGGNWPGNPDATTSFPQRMIVDYVRVYQKL
jgi:beta-glucanase (GH16 family)